MEYEISALADHPKHAAAVAARTYQMWGRLKNKVAARGQFEQVGTFTLRVMP